MLTTGNVRDDLLRCAGFEVSTLADPLLLARMLTDMNAAMQEVWSRCLPENRRQAFSNLIAAPVTLTNFTATNGSTVIAGGQTSDALSGNSLFINDDVILNELVNATTVFSAYRGTTTTTGGGTLYGDCVILDPSIVNVSWPLWIDGRHQMHQIRTADQWRRRHWASIGNGIPSWDDCFPVTCAPHCYQVGRPCLYRIEALNNFGPYSRVYRIRLYPLPACQYTLTYEAQIGAPSYDGFDDNVVLQLPRGLDESVFLPVVRYRFSSAPQFLEQIDRPTLAADYANALALLNAISPYTTGPNTVGTPVGY